MARKDIRVAYYEKTDEQKKRVLYYRKRKILNGDNEILKKMVEIVEQDVQEYHSDFYIHDVEMIKENEGGPFIWITREHGTHFINLISDEVTKMNEWVPRSYFEAVLRNLGDRIKGLYLVENDKIKRITKEKAFEVLKYYEAFNKRKLTQLNSY